MTGTPTALREHDGRHRPNTSAISSDAPLATLGWSVKSGCRIDESTQLDNPLNPVERHQCSFQLREDHQSAGTRRRDSIIERDILAQPSGYDLAVDEW